MTTALHLAGAGDLDRLEPMVAAYHAQFRIESDPARRAEALAPLLEGSPHGAVYLIGPRRAPVGYIAFSFGWSIGSGGLEGLVDEVFIRENVRGRGMGTEALSALIPLLESAGVTALHAMVDGPEARARRFFARLGFADRAGTSRMSRRARR